MITSVIQNPYKIVYIDGEERICSTLVGLLLEKALGILCAGELSQLPRTAWANKSSSACSCGELIFECRLWFEVR